MAKKIISNEQLLAPNGKPSNLNATQYALVRSKSFKNWFGDWENDPKNASKVVDENGEPLVVYHGTYVETPFYVFDFNKADLGFHFGTYEQAKNRSETKKRFFANKKSNITPFFLNIRTLFYASDIGEWEFPQRYIDMFVGDNIITETEAKKNGFYNAYYRDENKGIRDFIIKKHGNNVGFVYDNQHEGDGDSYIVLQESQIKLADGTNITFDKNNDDIRYEKGGLLAPNGNVSNLTFEQHKLVRSKAFKDWFGDWEKTPSKASKVVDENGEPLVVYHGSNQEFNIFDSTKIGGRTKYPTDGFYFDIEEKYATDYGQYVYPCFLNIKTPLKVDFEGGYYKGYKYDINKLVAFVKEGNSDWYGNKYDGVKANNIIDTPTDRNTTSTTYVAFKSNQIKLADGTNTTFDKKNPDIRFEKGGEVKTNKKVGWSIFGFVVGIITLGTINSK